MYSISILYLWDGKAPTRKHILHDLVTSLRPCLVVPSFRNAEAGNPGNEPGHTMPFSRNLHSRSRKHPGDFELVITSQPVLTDSNSQVFLHQETTYRKKCRKLMLVTNGQLVEINVFCNKLWLPVVISSEKSTSMPL